jgi:6-phosphofructokinase 1
MKEQKMYVPDLYERPEIREVSPGHLVRSGSTYAFDVNFGKEVGAAAVMLLSQGIFGVTVYQVDSDVIRYIPTRDAICRRYVDLQRVALYEQFDVCFGREKQPYLPRFEENRGRIDKFF